MNCITGYVYDEYFLDHILLEGHPESPERLRKIHQYMYTSGLIDEVEIITDEVEPQKYIQMIHSQEHYDSIMHRHRVGDIAYKAVARMLGAARKVSTGELTNAFCAIRPPGHHAHNNGVDYDGYSQGQGFCFFNNVAIAARYLQSRFGFKKIAIIDWDYHYGNGTAWSFRDDPSVLVFSTHNLYDYPGTGFPDYTGEGPGEGFTINKHMTTASGDEDILEVWHDTFIPRMEEFKPDFVLISAGFDSRMDDDLGVLCFTDAGFVQLTRLAMEIAQKYCNNRILSVLEGGYNPDGVARASIAHIATLKGLDWLRYQPPLSEKAFLQ